MPDLFLFFSHDLTRPQRQEAHTRLGVKDFISLPDDLQYQWSHIDPTTELTPTYMLPFTSFLNKNTNNEDYVLVQGDFGATYFMVDFCFAHQLKPIYSTTERNTKEYANAKGTFVKESIFSHIAFRPYLRYAIPFSTQIPRFTE
jgi:hypothetical protein